MKKQEIIEKIRKYNLALDDTHIKGSETFILICSAVIVNEFSFRDVREIHFVGNTMWIDNTSIESEDVQDISIIFTSVVNNHKEMQIQTMKKII